MAIVNLEACPDFSIVRQMQAASKAGLQAAMLPENGLRVIVAEEAAIDFVIP